MKCFVTLAALMACAAAEADPQFGLFARRGLLARSYIRNAGPPAALYNRGARVSYRLGAPAIASPVVAAPVAARAAIPVAARAAIPAVVEAPAIAVKAVPAALPAVAAVPAVGPVAVKAAVAPVAVPAAVPGVTSSQFHAQDELGNYEYGYSNANSAKLERGTAGLGVEGTYSYVDGHGLEQRVDYVADGAGFRVAGTNQVNSAAAARAGLPAVRAALPAALALPAHGNFAGARLFKRQVVETAAVPYSVPVAAAGLAGYASPYPLATAPAAYAGLALPAGPVAPLAYAAGVPAAPVAAAVQPAAREAILTTTQLNPGHAVAYRVD